MKTGVPRGVRERAAEAVRAGCTPALSLHRTGASEYDGRLGPVDFHVRREGAHRWAVYCFRAGVKDNDEAFLAGEDTRTRTEALLFAVEQAHYLHERNQQGS